MQDKIKMKTFEELKAFIELKAAEYEAVDEGETYENLWECELVEIQVLKEVASLALHEGTILENIDLSFYVENLSKTPDPDEVDEDECLICGRVWKTMFVMR